MIKISENFFIEPSDMSFDYHLYRNCVVENKKTKETRVEKKLQGYDMKLSRIIEVVAQQEALCEKQSTLIEYLTKVDEEIVKISKILKRK